MKEPRTALPESFAELERLIAARHGGLSSRLKDIAAFVLAHPNIIALETVATVAERALVPPSALVRFAQALGFDGFSDMQRLFRLRLMEQMPGYSHRLMPHVDGDAVTADTLERVARAAHRAIDELVAETPRAGLRAAAERLASGGRILIVAQRRSLPVATYLLHGLLGFGLPAQLLDNQGGMLGQQLRALASGDVLLAISFRPYAPETLEALRAAELRGLAIVAITDLQLSPLAASGRPTLLVRDAEVQNIRSLGASMCLATSLVIETGKQLSIGRSRKKEQAFHT